MAGKQPTCQQLAYLDELKERLQELHQRQEAFMEQTAEMLRCISTDQQSVPQIASPSISDTSNNEECSGGSIKQLIQRFEHLRQTSRQFSEEPLPEELAGVDVRRLLQGYEKLIVEGKILQKSWLLLKKTTENCARLSNRDERMLNKTSSKSPSFAEPASGTTNQTVHSTIISLSTTSGFLSRATQDYEKKSGHVSNRRLEGNALGHYYSWHCASVASRGKSALMGANERKP
ncbi:uncharacterized protein LOC6566627 isoform X2 [Drosophila grimshawi]|uniref:uncharacterized protein LOC6566627 isoform X2 n=1 Tax=Drosophila grimshawi TaxID=7222 RepID=UPI000C8700F9|nr:uncharacterized protein LOC6566627 isoform X2 [Drosophila grimshawi]